MSIQTELTRRLGLRTPILSAPMAAIAGGALAAAVSQAGGLGIVGGGYGDREWLSQQLEIASGTDVAVGFITWSLGRDPDLLTLALERRPKAIFLSFGDISPYAPTVAAAGVPLIAQVQSEADAKGAVAAGAQIIVAQGTEAGGHCGARATLPLVPAIVDAVPDHVPVVAAGGIADGRGLSAALMLGAAGVLCGTAFYTAEESLAHPNAKQAAVLASGDDTARGDVFDIVRGYEWPTQWQLRAVQNDFYQRWAQRPLLLKHDIARQRQAYWAAHATGDTQTAAVIVGEGVGLVRQIEPAATVVARISSEAEAQLNMARQWLL